jgi:hypothetical protein
VVAVNPFGEVHISPLSAVFSQIETVFGCYARLYETNMAAHGRAAGIFSHLRSFVYPSLSVTPPPSLLMTESNIGHQDAQSEQTSAYRSGFLYQSEDYAPMSHGRDLVGMGAAWSSNEICQEQGPSESNEPDLATSNMQMWDTAVGQSAYLETRDDKARSRPGTNVI